MSAPRDTAFALIEDIGTLLAADPALVAQFANPPDTTGTPRYFYLWAPQDCELPYLTANLTLRPGGREDPYQAGDFTLDIWDYSPTAARLFAMRQAIYTQLNRRIIEAAEYYARLDWPRGLDLSQPEVQVWRWSSTWGVRLYPIAEVAAIKART